MDYKNFKSRFVKKHNMMIIEDTESSIGFELYGNDMGVDFSKMTPIERKKWSFDKYSWLIDEQINR